MKVMYFIHTLDVGGAENVCVQYLLELQKRHVDVVLVVIAHRNNYLEECLRNSGIRIISIHPFEPQNFACVVINSIYRRLISLETWWNKLIKVEKPDVIHINTFFDYFSVTDFPYDRLIYTFHGNAGRYINRMNNNGRRKLKCYSEGGMKFFSLSSEMSASIRKLLCTENIIYMPNGVDIEGIRNQKYDRSEFLSKLAIDNDSLVLGHVARFHEIKNQARTVKIFQEVLKSKPNAFLLFVGNYDTSYGKKIKKMVAEIDLIDKVKFLGVREDAKKIMSILDAMVLPSITESFSLVMVEAQAHNVRAVASLAVPESVICNDNCFRLSLDDSDEKWANYLTRDFVEKRSHKLSDFAMSNVVDKLLVEYRKSAMK